MPDRNPASLALLHGLVEKWRASRAHTYASENADLYRGFDNGCARCADELEASLASYAEEARQIAEEMQHMALVAGQAALDLHGLGSMRAAAEAQRLTCWADAILALGTPSSAILPVDGK